MSVNQASFFINGLIKIRVIHPGACQIVKVMVFGGFIRYTDPTLEKFQQNGIEAFIELFGPLSDETVKLFRNLAYGELDGFHVFNVCKPGGRVKGE